MLNRCVFEVYAEHFFQDIFQPASVCISGSQTYKYCLKRFRCNFFNDCDSL